MNGELETLVVDDHVVDYLKRMQAEKPDFFYAIQGDNIQSDANVFWANGSCRSNYKHFGDTVRFELLYKSEGLKVPLVTFSGLNHHAQPLLFGCGLVFDESSSSFQWLFHTWLEAMCGQCPVSITIDLDQNLEIAVTNVLPKARLRFAKSSVLKETREKLAGVYQMHPALEIELERCINESDTIEEFESQWRLLLEKYSFGMNEWVQSLYNARHKWVPVFLKDVFFGVFLTSDGSDNVSSFFDGFVSSSTTMQLLFEQCERAISSWHENEMCSDSEIVDNFPILKTPSPMEKQAANLYTRKIFLKFQEELVETLANPATIVEDSGTTTTYRVSKFGEEQKAQIVTFYGRETKANCSCHMFEFSGIVCRHILSVFRARNVLTLPSQYILKRWTRDAKNTVEHIMKECDSEFCQDSQESLNACYDNLRARALKFVEEGAKSIQRYNLAMNALQEAAEKVNVAKKRISEPANGIDKATEDKKKKIQQLKAELQSTNQRCEVYRSNLMSILRDTEDQRLKLSIKIQNARLNLKD